MRTVKTAIFTLMAALMLLTCAHAAGFSYSDKNTGISFKVPANWKQEAFTTDAGNLQAKFVPTHDSQTNVFYSGVDAWSNLSASERAKTPRSEYDNSTLSKTEIANAFGTNYSSVSVVSYGGKEFFRAEAEQYLYTIVYLVRIENGYLAILQFHGDKGDTYYSDFESMARTISFPTSSSSPTGYSVMESVVLGIVISIVIHLGPIALYRFFIRKRPVDPRKAKVIAIIDGVVVFFVVSAITFVVGGRASSAAVVLWTFVSYRILICKNVEKNVAPAAEKTALEDAPEADDDRPADLVQRAPQTEAECNADVQVDDLPSKNIEPVVIDTNEESAGETPADASVVEEQYHEQNKGAPFNTEALPEPIAGTKPIERHISARASKPTIKLQPVNPIPARPAETPSGEIHFCYKCGTKLVSDGVYCYKCGTRVRR